MFFDFSKRLLDIIGSSIGLIIFSPLFLITAILIKLDSQGPVFYTPIRVGKDGEPFKMYKFRSMIMKKTGKKFVHAEEILRSNPKLLEQYKRNSYKLVDDPRVTQIGKFLRKYSVDEFPQLLNIFKGEMSLVGPRAYMPDELSEQQKIYPMTIQYVATLLSIKPGATGPWQVGGRSKINFDHRVRMDAAYALRRSLAYDLGILLKTVPTVLKGEGAT